MSKKYEKLTVWSDPDDSEVYTWEAWDEITEDELHRMHECDLMVAESITQSEKDSAEEMYGEAWVEPSEDFDEWLQQAIKDGYVREKR